VLRRDDQGSLFKGRQIAGHWRRDAHGRRHWVHMHLRHAIHRAGPGHGDETQAETVGPGSRAAFDPAPQASGDRVLLGRCLPAYATATCERIARAQSDSGAGARLLRRASHVMRRLWAQGQRQPLGPGEPAPAASALAEALCAGLSGAAGDVREWTDDLRTVSAALLAGKSDREFGVKRLE
jgi:hypothetical protein